ncbi:MAG: AbrB/MazE/SpoVT family DNA-binding domain-containing protein [Desulfurococcaceae archaeon]
MSIEIRKIIKVGKQSSAIVMPSKWIKQLGLNTGDRVKLVYDGSRIIITPIKEGEFLGGQVMIEGSDNVAFAKLIAAFMEGVASIKLKSEYEDAIRLLNDLKKEIPSIVFVARPDTEYHTIIFPDVGVDHNDLLVKLCEVFKKIIRNDGDPRFLLSDFNYTYLLLMRLLKIKYYENGLNVPEALDTVLFANTLNEIIKLIIHKRFEISEELQEAVSVLVDQLHSSDLDTAIKIASNTIVKANKYPAEIQRHILTLVELVFRRCIRDKACRCKHFFPKV